MDKTYSARKSWLMLVIIYLAAFSAPLNNFKVAALAPALIGYFGINADGIGFLMSAYTLTGVVLAFPAGGIARKLGYKRTSLIALVISIVGALMGCLAENMTVLLVSRVLEGVGLCTMGVTGISLVCGYFPLEKRGRALGVFTTYMALASCIGLPGMGALGDAMGFRFVWWVCLAFTVATTILLALFLKDPELEEDAADEPKMNMFKVIAQNKQLWLLCISFAIHNFIVVGVINNFATTYLTGKFGISMGLAGVIAAISALAAVLTMIIVGNLSDRFHTRKKFIVAGLVIGLVAAACYYWTDNFAFIIFITILAGIEGGAIPCMCQTTGPEILGSAKLAPVSQAFLSFGQNVGQFLGSAVFGMATVAIGWTYAGWAILVPLFIIALIAAIALKVK